MARTVSIAVSLYLKYDVLFYKYALHLDLKCDGLFFNYALHLDLLKLKCVIW